MDPRHVTRMKLVQNLFASSFEHLKENLPYSNNPIDDILKNVGTIDQMISMYAPKYPLNRIAKTDLAILRLAVYELKIKPTEPSKVVIDEAVELAKEFGGERSYAFVNAVLGSIIKE